MNANTKNTSFVENDSTEHNKSIQIKTNKTKLNKNTKSKWTYQFVKNQK